MKKIGMLTLMFVIMTSTVTISHAAGPSEERARGAYKMILSATDANQDGKMSSSECKAMYSDPAIAAKNCTFWDANHDGIITADEYAAQVMSIGKKK